LGTILTYLNETSFDFSYRARFKIVFAAKTHSAIGFEDVAVSQICDVQMLTGEAEVQMRFDQDEWEIFSGELSLALTVNRRHTR
jgi:hypothetical protein